MEKKNNQLQTRPVGQLLLSMSLPVMLSMLIQALYNIVDSIYVSRLGTDALTAVSLAYPLQNIIISVAVGTSVGMSSVISIYQGAGKQEKANQAASTGLVLTGISYIIIAMAGIFVTRPFLQMFTKDSVILKEACTYSYIVVCISFGCLFQIAMEKIFQGIGEMKVTMYLMIGGCIINIILDPILIFGLFGFPKLGVTGAAIATVIGQISAAIMSFVVYFRKNYSISIHVKYFKWDKEMIFQIYNVGLPSIIMMLLPSVLVSVLNRVLAGFSSVHIAVLGVYYKLQTFIYMPVNGLIQGMRPIIGFNYGAGEDERVNKTIRDSLLITGVIMLAGTLVAMFMPKQIFKMFDADEQLLKAGVIALRIICTGFLFSTIGVIYTGVFESLGLGKYSLIVSLLRQFVITIPMAVLFSLVLGVNGVWMAFPAGEVVSAFVSAILLKKYERGKYSPI